MEFLFILGGFAGLLTGGELLVRGSVSLAERFHVPPLVIGLTLVGFGTSAPELVTSIQAALVGAPGIAVGNVVGSNIANILLILGVAALLSPIAVSPRSFRRDGTALFLATLLCVATVFQGTLGRITGALFVAGLLVFLMTAFLSGRKDNARESRIYIAEAESLPRAHMNPLLALLIFVAGLVLTVFGARFLVDGAIVMARDFGISEAVIGLTIVAIGTSLPELVTSAAAARKGESDVAFGNVVGSSIFNILGILGITAVVQPLEVPEEIIDLDIWVMIGATLLLYLVAITGWRITRKEGGIMLFGYAAYLGYLAISSG